jgi:acetate kinase
LSYEYIYGRLQKLYKDAHEKKIVIAHLGSGASMAAIKNGKGYDTTMGFTPAGGLMMGSRTGDMDPGVLTYLLEQKGYDARRLSTLVNHQAGLKGYSGITGDMHVLLDRRESDLRAAETVDLYCYIAKKHMGALIAILDGLDILVFTGGIGESASAIRTSICASMNFAGIRLDENLNQHNSEIISSTEANVAVHVLKTDEERIIAEHTLELIALTDII